MTEPLMPILLILAWAGGFIGGLAVGSNLRLPRGSYGLPPDHDWRRSFNHENTSAPTGEPPLKFQRTVRLDEGRVQRGNRSGVGYQPKPEIDPKGQRRTPNPPPVEP